MIRALLALVAVFFALSGHAQDYPRTVVDLAGRSVTLHAPVQRIVLQDGNDLLSLALLEREDPFGRVVAWNNVLGSSDPSIWALLQTRWPHARAIADIDFDEQGSVDQEALIRLHPDLIIAQLAARQGIESTSLAGILQRLDIPVVYVDLEADPVRNTQRSIELLGRILGQEERAQAYLRFYRAHLQALARAKADQPKKRIFVEIRAGQAGLEQCCFSQGRVGWGKLIEWAGGHNIAADYLAGNTGDIALETLIRLKPDVYLMTGSQRQRPGATTIPFGYQVGAADTQRALARLMTRPGFSAIATDPQSCVYALYHQFYKSVFNIVGLEYLAQLLHPQRTAELDPARTYREIIERFTELPAAPLVLQAGRSFAGLPCGEASPVADPGA